VPASFVAEADEIVRLNSCRAGIEAGRILVRAISPDIETSTSELLRRAGELRAVYRIHSLQTRRPLFDWPVDRPLPQEVEGDTDGGVFRVVPERDVD
jgi:hypothetical protein